MGVQNDAGDDLKRHGQQQQYPSITTVKFVKERGAPVERVPDTVSKMWREPVEPLFFWGIPNIAHATLKNCYLEPFKKLAPIIDRKKNAIHKSYTGFLISYPKTWAFLYCTGYYYNQRYPKNITVQHAPAIFG